MSATDSPTVLVVDDEEDVADMHAELLPDRYEVLTAYNSVDATVQLDPSVDVVLMDRRMPGASGDEIISHVRNWNIDVRIAIVSAVEPSGDIVDIPFDDYLTKPVDADELEATVEQLLLFDQYEELLLEYNAVSKKRSILESRSDITPENEAIQTLEERREEIEGELFDLIDAFEEGGVASLLRHSHIAP